MYGVTKQQLKALDFIDRQTRESGGVCPSNREIEVAIDRARCGECDYIEGVRKGRILPREERLRLRHERAESDGTAEFDAAAHPYFAKLLTDWEREGIEAAAVFKSMARWMTYEKGRRRAAPDESQAASDLKAAHDGLGSTQERK